MISEKRYKYQTIVHKLMDKQPYLTADLPGIGGKFKTYPEDFYVEEIPLYQASGEGQHTYLQFEKVGLTTRAAINRIAQSLGIPVRRIGYAGLKDAQAVTRQMISIDNVSPERVAQLDLSGIKVIAARQHRNKIKVGHLAGNKFVIRIRAVQAGDLAQAALVLDRLKQQGVPNYYGLQRFGVRQNSHLLGLALIQNQPKNFLAELLGRPHPAEMQQAQQARKRFDEDRLEEAFALWPKSLRSEWLVLRRLIQTGDEQDALNALDKGLKQFFVSAYQSYLFNLLLSQRLDTIDKIERGDVAYIHRNGAAFVVREAEVEQPRVDQFEISPAGPLFGIKYLPAEAEPGQREVDLLNQAGLSLGDFNLPGVRPVGGRRPYRIPLTDAQLQWNEGIIVSFTLPPGGYATMVLREIMKNDQLVVD